VSASIATFQSRLLLHNNGSLPPVHELVKWPSYKALYFNS
jgi:hypothetical protein